MTQEKLQDIKSRFGIIGNSEGLNRAIERAYQVAPTEYSILVTGESGVGKEFFPKIVHAYSTRKHKQYIAINCGAIPNGTIDSELFGHVKGAFTGAINDHKGYFEEADGGTIFLDEVGELPLETQVRLLRVLETGEFIRVGSSTVQKTNVRVVAATNLNMQHAIDTGRFREDLYYRLSTISIQVPALRDRKEDIPLLFRKFAMDCTERYQMPPVKLTDDAKTLLQHQYWRGNIRQLKNIAEQVCVLEQKRELSAAVLKMYLPKEEQSGIVKYGGNTADTQSLFTQEMLYKVLIEMKQELDNLKMVVAQMQSGTMEKTIPSSAAVIKQAVISDSDITNYEQAEVVSTNQTTKQSSEKEEKETAEFFTHRDPIQQFEKEAIKRALEKNKGNRKLAASEVNLSERTLYRKIKEYGL